MLTLIAGHYADFEAGSTNTNTILGTREDTVSWTLWKDNRTRTRRLGAMAADSDARVCKLVQRAPARGQACRVTGQHRYRLRMRFKSHPQVKCPRGTPT